MRYIELNPVRAQNMANHPAEYPWSSYHFNALGKSDELITPHQEYKLLGSTEQDRQSAYRQLFRSGISAMTLDGIREATNKAWVLGSDQFKARISKIIGRAVQSRGHGGDRKSMSYQLKIKDS